MGKEKDNPIIVATSWRVKKKGLFELDKILRVFPKWFSKHQYDFFERIHDEKIKPDGKQVKSEWFAKREINDYVRFIITIEMLARRCVDVVVEDDGEKTEKAKGWIEVVMDSQMEKNYEKEKRRKFQYGETKGTFDHFMKLLYEKAVIKRKIEQYDLKLKMESLDLLETIKEAVEKS